MCFECKVFSGVMRWWWWNALFLCCWLYFSMGTQLLPYQCRYSLEHTWPNYLDVTSSFLNFSCIKVYYFFFISTSQSICKSFRPMGQNSVKLRLAAAFSVWSVFKIPSYFWEGIHKPHGAEHRCNFVQVVLGQDQMWFYLIRSFHIMGWWNCSF